METKNIYQKLADSKNEFGKLVKDSKNPFFKSKYLSLNALLSTIEPVLYKNGLLLLQPIEDGCVVTKIVSVDNDQSIESGIKLPEMLDPQKLGSAITYFRRYSLQSLLGLQAEDDDGNHAAKPQAKPDYKKIIAGFKTVDDINKFYKNTKAVQGDEAVISLLSARKKVLADNGITE